MAKIKDVITIIEEFAPLDLQCDFDNCGLKVGDVNEELSGVLVTLDTNERVVYEAIEKKCNLIVEHHPSIFRAIKAIDFNLPIMKAISLAIKNNIAIYSAHTNVDFCKGGLNDYVCKQLNLQNVVVCGSVDGPRMGELAEETTLRVYTEVVRNVFGDKYTHSIGNEDKIIKKVAIVNGGGGSNESDLLTAYQYGCDVFITGDIKYSVSRLAKDGNYAIINVGHYECEQGFTSLMKDVLSEKLDGNIIYQATTLLNPCN